MDLLKMNYSPITFNTLPTIYKKLNPNDFELIKNHNYVMYYDASQLKGCLNVS